LIGIASGVNKKFLVFVFVVRRPVNMLKFDHISEFERDVTFYRL